MRQLPVSEAWRLVVVFACLLLLVKKQNLVRHSEALTLFWKRSFFARQHPAAVHVDHQGGPKPAFIKRLIAALQHTPKHTFNTLCNCFPCELVFDVSELKHAALTRQVLGKKRAIRPRRF